MLSTFGNVATKIPYLFRAWPRVLMGTTYDGNKTEVIGKNFIQKLTRAQRFYLQVTMALKSANKWFSFSKV